MNWIKVNLFFLALGVIAAGSLFLLGFAMRSFGLAPDDHPFVLSAGAIGCLFLTYYAGKFLHSKLSR